MKILIKRFLGIRGRYVFRPRASRLGAALIIILCSILLVTVLALAFFASVGMERQSATSYQSGVEVKMLSESAVNFVIGQIRQASEQIDVIWTSQPGLLRTFESDGAPGNVYKLYSSQVMSTPAALFDVTNEIPSNWSLRTSEYVDLNRPVISRFMGNYVTNYPILDPRGIGKISGFSTNTSNGVAMPVSWLYLLKDGTITNSTGLSRTNEPVARIAFWTDDDTCKLDINTASQGNYWDVPHTATADDFRMATNQPAQREFQSYPGHPATTSLSPVLWSYFRNVAPAMALTNSPSTTNTFPEVLYSMLPRTHEGGSRGGTTNLAQTSGSLPLKTDRLFASVDELAFLPPGSDPTGSRQTNGFFSRDTIEQIRFFLTAYNRSPELNLFNLPRITIWPIHVNSDILHRTPYDNLIAFASTINGNVFYFNRQDANSPTADFAGRNVDIYKYLQRLTAQSVPGFGGSSFLTKYGGDRDQILTEIFDYVRCVNLMDSSSGLPGFSTFTPNSYKGATNLNASGKVGIIPVQRQGQVVPIAPPAGGPGSGTRGFGRFQTLNRALLVLSAATNYVDTGSVPPTTNTVTQAALFFETFSPAQGHVVFWPYYDVAVTSSPFSVVSGGRTNSFSFSGTAKINYYGSDASSRNVGGYDGFVPNVLWGNYYGRYPYVTEKFTNVWSSTNPTIELRGGEVTAQIRANPAGATNGGPVVQTITFGFPAEGIAVPMPKPETVAQTNDYRDRLAFARAWSLGGMNFNKGAITSWYITTNDVARSLEATGVSGDLRLLAAKISATNVFLPVTNYFMNDQRHYSALATQSEQVAGLYFSDGTPVDPHLSDNQLFGRLVQNAQSETNPMRVVDPSYVPAGINGVTNSLGSAGDWDTGIGSYPNGPLINKPDDGNTFVMNANGTYQDIPYIYLDQWSLPPGGTFSSPSRQIPSAVMFGSLPTGVMSNAPWQTLLFCANPASHYGPNPSAHPGETSPRDHLLLDLFHIPIVEPYAISEPFSTAGKINMNYQIVPFVGIQRKSGLYGVLDAVKVTAINDTPLNYKRANNAVPIAQTFRYPINIPETLKYFDSRFSTNGVFRSASEICDILLIPDPTASPAAAPYPTTAAVTTNNIDDFWKNFGQLTGDNLRENPYALIYERLTTRSNTYTVHVWVQTLKKVVSTDVSTWTEDKDRVTGEFRGSFSIERYLDPADPDIPDAATLTTSDNLNRFYRYRVLNVSQFNP